jgi:hypothetical protein
VLATPSQLPSYKTHTLIAIDRSNHAETTLSSSCSFWHHAVIIAIVGTSPGRGARNTIIQLNDAAADIVNTIM